ncbi:MAG: hypothetical protein ABSA68_02585 [Xanthobacteraceae bacterium]|jgi:hypothetical protein
MFTETEVHHIGPSGDELIWREFSLALTINRHVADYFDDETVSQHLRHVAAQHRLPWEM